MKNRFALLIITAVLISVWSACDKIDDPLKVVNVQNIPEDLNDTLFYVDSVSVTQKQVLLEDFTGHKCVNCPEAALAAHGWSEQLYDHKLIIYSIHSGYYATPDESGLYTLDLTCPTGDELYAHFNIFANPSATVDRVPLEGNVVLYFSTGEWETAVQKEMQKENLVDLKIKNTYYPNRKAVLVDVVSSFKQNLDGKFKIVVYIVEDHIISPQKNNNTSIGPTPDWEEYDHRNVLRDAVNGTYGNYISTDGTIEANEEYQNRFFYTINSEWITQDTDLNIIAFIVNDDSGEIIQVGEAGIKTRGEE